MTNRVPKPGSVAATNIRIAELHDKSSLTPDERTELDGLRRWRAERMARRRTEFERDQVPLLAEQIPETQAQDYLDADELNRQAWSALHEKHRACAQARRQDVARSITPEDLAAMDTRWENFRGPHTPTYEADFWLQRYRDTFHRNPLDLDYRPGEPWPPPDYDRCKLDPAKLDEQKQHHMSL